MTADPVPADELAKITTPYWVVETRSLFDLERWVNALATKGYVPVGGVAVNRYDVESSSGGNFGGEPTHIEGMSASSYMRAMYRAPVVFFGVDWAKPGTSDFSPGVTQ